MSEYNPEDFTTIQEPVRTKPVFSSRSVTVGAAPCCCIGPKNGQPLCPCKMKNVKEKNGRYIEIIDHGPINPQ